MKTGVKKRSDEEMLQFYDRQLRHKGWYVRVDEAANGCWIAEAEDVLGRKVGRSGNDPDELIKRLEEEIEKSFILA